MDEKEWTKPKVEAVLETDPVDSRESLDSGSFNKEIFLMRNKQEIEALEDGEEKRIGDHVIKVMAPAFTGSDKREHTNMIRLFGPDYANMDVKAKADYLQERHKKFAEHFDAFVPGLIEPSFFIGTKKKQDGQEVPMIYEVQKYIDPLIDYTQVTESDLQTVASPEKSVQELKEDFRQIVRGFRAMQNRDDLNGECVDIHGKKNLVLTRRGWKIIDTNSPFRLSDREHLLYLDRIAEFINGAFRSMKMNTSYLETL